MPAKKRVYELSKEFGLTNEQVLRLAESLGIGVRGSSSSMVEAQVDLLRRKAEREGLIQRQAAPDPIAARRLAMRRASTARRLSSQPAPRVAGAKARVTDTKAPDEVPATAQAATSVAVEAVRTEPVPSESESEAAPKDAEAKQDPEIRQVSEAAALDVSESEPDSKLDEAISTKPGVIEADVPADTKDTELSDGEISQPAEASLKRVISSSGSTTVPRRVVETSPMAASATPTKKVIKRVVKKVVKKAIVDPSRVPTSGTGKPIPPPPRAKTGRFAPSPSSTGGRPGSSRPDRSPGRTPAPAGRRPAGGLRGAVPGAGPPPGGGRGAPGGRGGPGQNRGGPGQRPPRRKGRRRRIREELQPMDAPSYTPRDAPVPEGEVVVERASTSFDLGPKLNRTAADVVRFLMQAGEMVTANQSLSDDLIELFAAEIGATVRLVNPGEEQEVELQKLLEIGTKSDSTVSRRPPVVTVMGHVDHGKTLLLDRIRNTDVIKGEAGGITQHIGAYQVSRDSQRITFLDTPGHEAFTAMRARGANATDIVVLVVAADDGVMPQTIEAINHAKAADVPILVAINKIDRPNADPDKAIAGVAEHGLVPEQWGGETIFQRVSALNSVGIDELLDQILLLAEIEDLRTSGEGRAQGVVLEAVLDIGRGPVATVLVQRGTLMVGDPIVAGAAWGRVRALIADTGNNITEAGPSTPVQVLGLSDVASAGDEFVVAPNERVAGRVAGTREHWQRQSSLGREAHALSGGARLEDIFEQIRRGEAATLNMVVKTDVNGSLEAVTESLRKLERNDVRIGFVHRGVGGITENDISLAAASSATIIGFNVRPDRKARELAEVEQVEVRTYEIIYKLLEDIESAMVGLLAPEFEEVVTGDAEVRRVFRIPRVGAVAGCLVQNGVITRGSGVRFLRDGAIIWKGQISSLKRFSEDARQVSAGFECGIGLSDFQDLKEGDIIETYEEREIQRSLNG